MRQFIKGLLVIFGVEIEVKQTLFAAGGPPPPSSAGVEGAPPLNGEVAVFSLSSSPSWTLLTSSSSDDMSPKSSRTGRRPLVDVGLSSSTSWLRSLFSDGRTTWDEGAEFDSVWLKSLGLRSASVSAVASK